MKRRKKETLVTEDDYTEFSYIKSGMEFVSSEEAEEYFKDHPLEKNMSIDD
jgi:hypothetical protein